MVWYMNLCSDAGIFCWLTLLVEFRAAELIQLIHRNKIVLLKRRDKTLWSEESRGKEREILHTALEKAKIFWEKAQSEFMFYNYYLR